MIGNLRVRLTVIYGGIFVVFVAVLLGVSYWLMGRHLHRTLGDVAADAAQSQLGLQYLLFLAGASLVAGALGWWLAGRELRSMASAFDARERFVANASHELRSPLTVIRTEADVAMANPDADVAELRAMGREVVAAVDDMDALLDGLMVLARSGHGLSAVEPVDLAVAARAAAQRVRSGAVQVRLDLAPAGVRGERRLLERLAANLIENGVRYNAPGGFVSVTTRASDAGAVLDVVNSGPVVSPDTAARLTEPFERGGRTGQQGAGLGLSIVRSVAEAHGGRLALMPRAEGGLSVRVSLPAA
ncbi:signal transduction histidine kinase [Solirubrobacter pauli]|uniref:histidine kinase n=1 Tax=Solirubrobacter pauli TaxID=166793 RepID=A0A660LDY4_9ACTN|nr:HAMP domain-containing sensor histidine kinase [Solirubrobacter pauli]RKQ90961.1 signal transduction histidine kinase [Solirubrobacter pauli]